jgi:hypothetical protein
VQGTLPRLALLAGRIEVPAKQRIGLSFNASLASRRTQRLARPVSTTKGNRLRPVPMTLRLAAALQKYRHSAELGWYVMTTADRSRNMCDGLAEESRATRQSAMQWTAHSAPHVLFASGDERRADPRRSGTRRPSRSDDDAEVHAPQSECGRERDPITDGGNGRGDIVETAGS